MNMLRLRMNDIFSGFAAMLVTLPSAIAFGIIVYSPLGMSAIAQGAMTGIIGAIIIGTLAPLLGGAPRLVSGPCGPAAALLLAFVTELLHSQPQDINATYIASFIMLIVILAGIIQLSFGLLGGGKLIKYIPYPVVAGYLSSVGILIFIGQLPKLLGTASSIPTYQALKSPSLWNLPSLIIGLSTILMMFVAPRLIKGLPAVIVSLLCGVTTYFILAYSYYPQLLSQQHNPLIIGSLQSVKIDAHFFQDLLGKWWLCIDIIRSNLLTLLAPAFSLAVLLSIDTLKTCVVLDTLTRSRHHSNRELCAQGISNLGSGLMSGLAGAGMMGATLVNISSGATTRLSGICSGIFALLTFFLLGNLVAWVPVSSLAGILLVISMRMIDRSSLKLAFNRSTMLDFLIILAVIISAISFSLIAATGVGIGIAILLFLREQIQTTVVHNKTSGNQFFSKRRRLPEAMSILKKHGDQIVIVELKGILFFGTTDQLIAELYEAVGNAKYLILDFKRVRSIDFTAAHMLEQIEDKMTEQNGWVLFSDLPETLPTGQDVRAYLNDVGLVRETGNLKIFPELDDAMEWAEDQLLESYGYDAFASAPPLSLAEIHLFSSIPEEIIALFEKSMPSKTYEEGEKIFSVNDSGDNIYFVRKGRVKILLPINHHRHRLVATIGRGDFFGDIVFLDGGKRTGNAIAASHTELYTLSRRDFDVIARDYPSIGEQFFERLAYSLAFRLRVTDEELMNMETR